MSRRGFQLQTSGSQHSGMSVGESMRSSMSGSRRHSPRPAHPVESKRGFGNMHKSCRTKAADARISSDDDDEDSRDQTTVSPAGLGNSFGGTFVSRHVPDQYDASGKGPALGNSGRFGSAKKKPGTNISHDDAGGFYAPLETPQARGAKAAAAAAAPPPPRRRNKQAARPPKQSFADIMSAAMPKLWGSAQPPPAQGLLSGGMEQESGGQSPMTGSPHSAPRGSPRGLGGSVRGLRREESSPRSPKRADSRRVRDVLGGSHRRVDLGGSHRRASFGSRGGTGTSCQSPHHSPQASPPASPKKGAPAAAQPADTRIQHVDDVPEVEEEDRDAVEEEELLARAEVRSGRGAWGQWLRNRPGVVGFRIGFDAGELGVHEVTKGGPAEKAGLRAGDELVWVCAGGGTAQTRLRCRRDLCDALAAARGRQRIGIGFRRRCCFVASEKATEIQCDAPARFDPDALRRTLSVHLCGADAARAAELAARPQELRRALTDALRGAAEQRCREAFARIDANGDGVLTRREVGHALRNDAEVRRLLLGSERDFPRSHKRAARAINGVYSVLDADGSNGIEFWEFQEALRARDCFEAGCGDTAPKQSLREAVRDIEASIRCDSLVSGPDGPLDKLFDRLDEPVGAVSIDDFFDRFLALFRRSLLDAGGLTPAHVWKLRRRGEAAADSDSQTEGPDAQEVRAREHRPGWWRRDSRGRPMEAQIAGVTKGAREPLGLEVLPSLFVCGVLPGSGADRAGLARLVGRRLVSVAVKGDANDEVETVEDAEAALRVHCEGCTVAFLHFAPDHLTMRVWLRRKKKDDPWGFSVGRGMRMLEERPSSSPLAAKASRLRKQQQWVGATLTHVNGRAVGTPKDVKRVLHGMADAVRLPLQIQRVNPARRTASESMDGVSVPSLPGASPQRDRASLPGASPQRTDRVQHSPNQSLRSHSPGLRNYGLHQTASTLDHSLRNSFGGRGWEGNAAAGRNPGSSVSFATTTLSGLSFSAPPEMTAGDVTVVVTRELEPWGLHLDKKLVITGVADGSPADRVGLRSARTQMLTKINGQAVKDDAGAARTGVLAAQLRDSKSMSITLELHRQEGTEFPCSPRGSVEMHRGGEHWGFVCDEHMRLTGIAPGAPAGRPGCCDPAGELVRRVGACRLVAVNGEKVVSGEREVGGERVAGAEEVLAMIEKGRTVRRGGGVVQDPLSVELTLRPCPVFRPMCPRLL